MQKSFFGLLISFFFIQIVFAQQIPNSGFEDWINSNQANGWTCSITNGLTLSTAEKSSDSYSGDFAVKLQTKQILTGDVIPGMIQLGQIDVNTLDISGGIPFTAKPSAFEVFLKYDQKGTDSLVIFCYLTKYDQNLKKTIRIGGSYFVYSSNIDNYKSFVFPIYYTEEGTPDTINIGFFSSANDRTIGTTLWLDKLKLLYGNYLLPPIADLPKEVSDTGFIAKWAGADYTKSFLLDVSSDKEFTDFLPGFNLKNVGNVKNIHVSIPDTSIKRIYYRVKADYDSVITDYSQLIGFDVPYAPNCFNPDIVTSKYFVAKWNRLENAEYYILDVATDSNFTDFVPNYYYFKTDTIRVSIVGLERDTKYYYRVRAGYLGLKSNYSDTVEVRTPVSDYGGLIQFFLLPDKLIIFADESMYNSPFVIYDFNGKIFQKGNLSSRYTEIPIKTIQILIFKAETPQGIIIKKLGIYSRE